MIEESPSPIVSEELRQELGEKVVQAMKAIDYQNAGTVEFLFDQDGSYYFLEMNTRVQVEHPVTEMVTGLDIVKEQIRAAAGQKLRFSQKGHRLSWAQCRMPNQCGESRRLYTFSRKYHRLPSTRRSRHPS